MRGAWNLFHHNCGRLALLLGWANIWLGVAWWHADDGVFNLQDWVVPLAGWFLGNGILSFSLWVVEKLLAGLSSRRLILLWGDGMVAVTNCSAGTDA